MNKSGVGALYTNQTCIVYHERRYCNLSRLVFRPAYYCLFSYFLLLFTIQLNLACL